MKTEQEIKEAIDQASWGKTKTDALDNLTWDSDNQQVIGRSMLGSIFSITPSGKFYTPFACSNVSEDEASLDEYFHEYLETVASNHDMFIDHYEETIFACVSLELNEVTSDHVWITSDDKKLFEAHLLGGLDNDNSKALALWIQETEGYNLIDILTDITESGDSVDYGKQSYLVLTDEEADTMFSEYCRNYVDDCLDLPEIAKRYFDYEAFECDCSMDGRGHSLASYDSAEECFTYAGTDYYIYRTN